MLACRRLVRTLQMFKLISTHTRTIARYAMSKVHTLFTMRFVYLFVRCIATLYVMPFATFYFRRIRSALVSGLCCFSILFPFSFVSHLFLFLFLPKEAWPLVPSFCFNSIPIIIILRLGLFTSFLDFTFFMRNATSFNNIKCLKLDAEQRTGTLLCKCRFRH